MRALGPSARIAVVVIAAVVGIAGCASKRPAPVVDRLPPAKPAPPAATAPAPAVPARPETYTVKRGDTLYSIALDNGVDWRELSAWNQLSDPAKLRVGQVLLMKPPGAPPGDAGLAVTPVTPTAPIAGRPLDSPPSAAGSPAASPAAPPTTPTVPPAAGAATAPAASSLLRTEPKGLRLPYSEENLALVRRSESVAIATPKPDAVKPDAPKPEAPAAGAKPAAPLANPEAPAAKPTETENADGIDWSWPATGKIVATFNGSSVKGIAIGGRVGDPVYATAAGKVVYSGEGIPAYGKLIVIRHSETYLSAYAHNSQILVKDGQTVARGQKIAEIGTTGTDAAQLHFEIRRQGKPVDPLQFLPARP